MLLIRSIDVYLDEKIFNVIVIKNITMEQGTWETTCIGVISGSRVWLRVSAFINPDANENDIFSYSLDGANFVTLGTPFSMLKSWQLFVGYRFGIFEENGGGCLC